MALLQRRLAILFRFYFPELPQIVQRLLTLSFHLCYVVAPIGRLDILPGLFSKKSLFYRAHLQTMFISRSSADFLLQPALAPLCHTLSPQHAGRKRKNPQGACRAAICCWPMITEWLITLHPPRFLVGKDTLDSPATGPTRRRRGEQTHAKEGAPFASSPRTGCDWTLPFAPMCTPHRSLEHAHSYICIYIYIYIYASVYICVYIYIFIYIMCI